MVQLAPHGTPKRYQQYPKGAERCSLCKAAWAAHCQAKRGAGREARDAAGPLARAAERGRGDGTAARLEALWAAEAEAERTGRRGWRAELEASDSGHDCPNGHPRYRAGAHTVLVCLECNERDSSPGAQAREADLEQARAERKARGEAVARRGPTDTDVLALERRKGVMLEQLADYTERARLRPGDARVIEHLEQQIDKAESDERLDEIIGLLAEHVKRPRIWQDSAAEQVLGALGEGEGSEAEAALATPASIAAQQQRASAGSSWSWADYDRDTAAAARASAMHAAQVRQLRAPGANPRPDAFLAQRQGFSPCACGGWIDPAKRHVTPTGAWCKGCGAAIRSPLAGAGQ